MRLCDVLRIAIVPSVDSYAEAASPFLAGDLKPALIAAAWDVAGRRLLSETRQEARTVASLLGVDESGILGLDASRPATFAEIVTRLPMVHTFHFSGHAEVDFGHPDLSHLVVHDVAETRLAAGTIADLDLSLGRLAFLSACAVGHSRGRLRDDPFDLAAAFVYAGFQRVVAPLRAIPDDEARASAEAFYRTLTEGGAEHARDVDVHGAFDAMVAAMREQHPLDVMAWAGFVLVEAPTVLSSGDPVRIGSPIPFTSGAQASVAGERSEPPAN